MCTHGWWWSGSEVKGWKKIYHAKTNYKKSGVVLLMSDKADFWIRHTTKDEKEHFRRVKDSFYLTTFNTKEDLKILDMLVLSMRFRTTLDISSCMKQHEKLDKICETVVFKALDSRQQRTVVPWETGNKWGEPNTCFIYRLWCRDGEHRWSLVTHWMENPELMVQGDESSWRS